MNFLIVCFVEFFLLCFWSFLKYVLLYRDTDILQVTCLVLFSLSSNIHGLFCHGCCLTPPPRGVKRALFPRVCCVSTFWTFLFKRKLCAGADCDLACLVSVINVGGGCQVQLERPVGSARWPR